jgi:hypothetical protein
MQLRAEARPDHASHIIVHQEHSAPFHRPEHPEWISHRVAPGFRLRGRRNISTRCTSSVQYSPVHESYSSARRVQFFCIRPSHPRAPRSPQQSRGSGISHPPRRSRRQAQSMVGPAGFQETGLWDGRSRGFRLRADRLLYSAPTQRAAGWDRGPPSTPAGVMGDRGFAGSAVMLKMRQVTFHGSGTSGPSDARRRSRRPEGGYTWDPVVPSYTAPERTGDVCRNIATACKVRRRYM